MKKSKEEEFMKDYHQIDLALDTFPYTGVTTSFQSYLMGVPVLTLKGFNLNSRCGESINKNLSLEEFIANDHLDYYNKSMQFQDSIKLSKLRLSLRQKVLNSPLFDTNAFVQDLSRILIEIMKKV
tara:strand:- start:306 stop:680 length:375 start_codon:yes stop_codon:yes gene_type:complete